MFGTKLCLGINKQFGISGEDQIRLFYKTGFEAFFTGWDSDLPRYRQVADELGMIYQSVHAPFGKAAKIWRGGDEAKAATTELLKCVSDCAAVKVPILIVHPYIGFEDKADPTESGVENFRMVVEAARTQNVKIAFENVEGQEYLDALMQAFDSYENVGFCWDSGHELCYNKGKDMLALYGHKLIATHINDNLGVSDYGGRIFWTDDLHLLPFDGVHDWRSVAKRLNDCGYEDILTFELTTVSKPNRHENDKYAKMPLEEYIAECYIRACRLAYMRKNISSH